MTECYDFPDMVVHKMDCPYTTGGVCHPRPSSEAPDDIVKEYVKAVAFHLLGVQPESGHYEHVPKRSGRSIDPHTGEIIT